MKYLAEGDRFSAQSGLKNAQLLLDSNGSLSKNEKFSALVSVTLNNQACYYNTYFNSVSVYFIKD